MEKEKVVALAKTGSALVFGTAATVVVNRILGAHLPVPKNVYEKAMFALGTFGIGVVASQAVGDAMEKEVDDLATCVDYVSSMVQEKEGENGERSL